MIRTIVTYPNKKLLNHSNPINEFNNDLHSLLNDMYDTMIAAGGIGLAAVQIGEPQNVLIVNLPNDDGEQNKSDLIEVINPTIIQNTGQQFHEEGCLSIPGFQAKISRYDDIVVEYYDRFGKEQIIDANGYLSVALQHEIDHLRGKLFIEKLSIIDRKRFKKYLEDQIHTNDI